MSLVLSSLAIVILFASIIIIVSLSSNRVAYAHTFSENENALFLTLVHQIEAQTMLTQNNFPTNSKLAEQYANNAINLLNQNDPVVNSTWTSQISERNSRVAYQLTSALNSLKDATASTTAADSGNNIKTTVKRINGLLGEAISSRIPKETLNNSTTQALVLANLANEVYFSYGRALGESPSTMSNMAGMAMAEKEASPSSTTNSSNMTMSSSGDNAIKNVTEYQTTQALASKTKEVFNNNLKSTAPSTLKAANTEIENDLNQLKAAIDNKTPFIDVMKIVHIQLHPTLITAYNLQLESFQYSYVMSIFILPFKISVR